MKKSHPVHPKTQFWETLVYRVTQKPASHDTSNVTCYNKPPWTLPLLPIIGLIIFASFLQYFLLLHLLLKYGYTSGSQVLVCIRITWKAYENIDFWASPQSFWFHRAQEFAFLSSCQVMLMLLAQGPHFEKLDLDVCCPACLWNPWEFKFHFPRSQDNGTGGLQ